MRPVKNQLLASLISITTFAGVSLASDSPDSKPKVSADFALEILVSGNKRFVGGRPMFPDQSPNRRREIAAGQKPFAIVLTCADSRVAPEIYFDQGLGNLFVVRNAGNILNDHTIGSIEYAVEHLRVGLIVVVGHEKCGAVAAAVAGGHAPGHVHSIIESILPAVKESADLPGDKVDNAVRANAGLVAAALRSSDPILKEAVAHGRLKVVAARYELATGKVVLLETNATAPAAHATNAAADGNAAKDAHAAPAKVAAH